MYFKSITIQGFRTFINKQTFSFSDIADKSLNYVTGENKVEVSLEGNDVGKSSLFEALCFCLYGTTSTKLRAGDVANWSKSKKCFVQIEFESNKELYILRRQWNPNKLILIPINKYKDIGNEKEITQEQLEDIIGLNFSGFLYSVFISQCTAQFFDLDPMDKLKIFSDMLRLEGWIDRSEKAKNKVKDISINIESITNKKYKFEGKLDVLSDQNYDVDIGKWDADRREKIKNLKSKESSLSIIDKDLSKNKKELNSEYSSVLKALELVKYKVIKSEKEFSVATEKWHEIKTKILSRKGLSDEIKRTITKFEGVKDACPYCNQKVSETYLRDQLRDLDARLDNFTSELKVMICDEKLLKKKEDITVKAFDKFDGELDTMKEDLRDIQNELGIIKVKINTNKEAITNLESDINDLHSMVNPYCELKKKNIIDKQEVTGLLAKMEKSLEGLNKECSLYEFWVKGFKDIRLFVVSQALQEFEICINNNLHCLGLSDWRVKLDVEREVNKGKSLKRGFSVIVQSPYNEGFVSFKCWGGGVSQRLRLAGTMGLIDLIRSRTGVECNIEIWDEPTQFLSPRGIEDTIQVLYDRSRANSQKIFLIDHRNLSSHGLFDSVINIVKCENGSIIKNNF